MASINSATTPPGVLRRVSTARSVLVNVALGEAFVRSLPFAGGTALAVALTWYLAAGSLEPAAQWLAPTLVAAAFLVLAGTVVVRRAQRLPTVLAAAVELDQSAKTHSALASSLEFALAQPGPFEQWALANAAREAERGDLTMPTPPPIRGALPRMGIGAGLLAAAIVFVLVVPPRPWSPEAGALAAAAIDPARVTEAQQAIEDAQVEVTEAAEDLGIEADNQFFDSLEAELEEGLRDPDEILAKAAEQLDELAEQAETEADRADRARDNAAERLAELEPEEFNTARDLAEALAAGDFDQAAQEAESLGSNLGDPAARDDLRRLAEQLDQAADAEPDTPPTDPEQSEQDTLAQDLRDLADELREQADTAPNEPTPPTRPPSEPTDPSNPDSSNRDPNQPDTQPEPPAEPPAEDVPEPPTDQPNGQDPSDPNAPEPQSDQGPSQPQPSEPTPDTEPQPSDQGEPAEQPQDPSQPSEQQPTTQPDPDQQDPSPEPGEQPGQQQQQDQRPGEKPPPDQQPQNQPADQQQDQPSQDQPPQDQPSPDQPSPDQPSPDQPSPAQPGQQPQPDPNAPDQPGEPNPNQPPQPGPNQPDPNAPPQPSPGNPDQPSPEGPVTQTPGDRPDTTPGRPQPDQPNQPGAPSDDPDAEPTTLERLAQEQRRGDDLRRFADDLRDRADEMLTDSPEGDRAPATPNGEQPSDEPLPPAADPWSAPTELVDARDTGAGEDARERVISEWFKDPEGRPLDAAAPAEARDAISRAARDAERAVEQQTVPRRYEDLVRRVFERYARQTDAATDASKATDASDAE